MKLHSFIILPLLFLFGCSSDKPSSNSTETISRTLSAKLTAGTVAPSIYYVDNVTISGNNLQITRTGGIQIVTGSWTTQLNDAEVNELNALLLNISASDMDTLLDSGSAPSGGPFGHIFIGSDLKFYMGNSDTIGDTQYHLYASDVQAISDKIWQIINNNGLGVSYISAG